MPPARRRHGRLVQCDKCLAIYTARHLPLPACPFCGGIVTGDVCAIDETGTFVRLEAAISAKKQG